jgi:hypothetical protein
LLFQYPMYVFDHNAVRCAYFPRGKKLIAIKTIIGNLWQSLTIFGNHWQSLAIFENL